MKKKSIFDWPLIFSIILLVFCFKIYIETKNSMFLFAICLAFIFSLIVIGICFFTCNMRNHIRIALLVLFGFSFAMTLDNGVPIAQSLLISLSIFYLSYLATFYFQKWENKNLRKKEGWDLDPIDYMDRGNVLVLQKRDYHKDGTLNFVDKNYEEIPQTKTEEKISSRHHSFD